jgi:hypothetical protein
MLQPFKAGIFGFGRAVLIIGGADHWPLAKVQVEV